MRNFRSGALVLCFVFLSIQRLLGQAPATPVAVDADLVEAPAWLYNDIACAPSLTTEPAAPVKVMGSQDTVIKHMLGPGDMVVVSGGAAAGLEPGQRFYVRRLIRTFGNKGPDAAHPVSVHTAGWIQILAVDSKVATASVVHACEGLLLDDYLEPFSPPMIAARSAAGSAPQYSNMGHITAGDENMGNVGTGQMIGIDRGGSAGVKVGQRFLVFRDKRAMRNESPEYSVQYMQNRQNVPLVEVAEVLVVLVKPDSATVQVTMARDSVMTGDFIAEIR